MIFYWSNFVQKWEIKQISRILYNLYSFFAISIFAAHMLHLNVYIYMLFSELHQMCKYFGVTHMRPI